MGEYRKRKRKKRKVTPLIVSGAVVLLVLIGLLIFTNRPETEVIEQQSLPEYLEQTIDYIKNNNVKILTFGEAVKLRTAEK